MTIHYLDVADLMAIGAAVLDVDQDALVKVADLNLADSALHAPQAGFGDFDYYPDFEIKVGVLGYHLLMNHALPDGNKRAALQAMIEFVERNGRTWLYPQDDDTYDHLLQAAAGTIDEATFIDWVALYVEEP